MKRTGLVTLIVLAGLVGLGWYQSIRPKKTARLVAFVPSVEQIYASGRIEGRSPEIAIGTTLAERIVSILVREGQKVRTGDVLIQLDESQYNDELHVAAAEVEIAKSKRDRLVNGARESEIDEAKSQYNATVAEHTLAQRLFERARNLLPERAVSIEFVEQMEARLMTSEAQMQAAWSRLQTISAEPRPDDLETANAELKLAQARLNLSQTMKAKAQLRAPSDGEILQINVEVGELASPISVQPLIIMSDTSALRIRVSVDETDGVYVKVGQSAEVTSDSFPGRKFVGEVVKVRPQLGERESQSLKPEAKLDSRERPVWISLQNDDGLIVGQPVDVWIHAPSINREVRNRIDHSDRPLR